jgi:hypothetical protein|tara:strand:- start:1921 stop:2547 length:627 start_codon:yes stop_codon:yes gene_type:complete
MPSWKKLITSGSNATLSSLSVDNQITGSSLTGSFTGSYSGDGSDLTGINPFPFTGSASVLGDLTLDSPGNDYVDDTYVNDYLFGGNALIVSDNAIFSGSITALNLSGSVSGSFQGDISTDQLRINSINDYIDNYVEDYIGGIALITTGSAIIEGGADIIGQVKQSAGAVILTKVSESLNFTNDTNAADGGVPLGGLYRNGNDIKIRIT